MTDFARLVLSADATGLAKGETALRSIAATAGQTEAKVGASTAELGRAFTQTGAAAEAASAKVVRMQTGVGKLGPAFTNASFQVQDFAIQVAAGTSATTAMAQQLPQLLGAFGFVGKLALAGSLLGTMVAVGAAVIPMLMKTGTSADELADRIGDLASAVNAYQNAAAEARRSVADLTLEFGSQALVVKDALRDLQAFNLTSAVEELRKVGDGFNDLSEAAIRGAAGLSGLGKAAAQGADVQAMREFLRVTGMTADEALRLNSALDAMDAASGVDATLAAATELRQVLLDTYGSAERIPPELQAMARAATETMVKASALKADLDGSAVAAQNAAANAGNLAGALGGAAQQASLLSSFLGGIPGAIARMEGSIAGARAGMAAIAAGGDATAGSVARFRAELEASAGPMETMQDGQRAFVRESIDQQVALYEEQQRTNSAYSDAVSALNKVGSAGGFGGGGAGGAVSSGMREAAKATKEAEKAAQEYADALNAPIASAIDGLADAVGDSLTDGFDGFFDTILSTFKSTISQMVSFAIANPIKLALGIGGSGFAGAANAATGGGGLLGGLLGGGSGIMSGLTGVLQQGGILGTLGQSFGSLGGLLTGGIGGLGAIGAAIPAIGAIVLLASALIGKKEITGAGLAGSIWQGGANLENWETTKSTKLFGAISSSNTDVTGLDSSGISAAAGMYYDAAKSLGAALGLQEAGQWVNQTFGFDATGMSQDEVQARLTAEVEKYGATVADATLGTTYYTKAGETSLETMQRLVTSMTAVNTVTAQLGHNFQAAGLYGASLADSLVDLFGGIESFNAAASTYAELFYTEEEKRNRLIASTTSSLAAVGLSLPSDRFAYRTMVEAADLNTEAGQQAYAVLLGLSGALDKILPPFEALTEAIEETTDAVNRMGIFGADGPTWRNYASGGYHSGGLRVVGENGPELEATGPSMIYNSARTKAMLGGSSEIAAMREEMRQLMLQVARNTKRMADLAQKSDIVGQPPVRAA